MGGRPRDKGTEQWATVTEVAEALGVTYQAIRNRMKAGTCPYEEHIESGRPSYRIPRSWLDAELKKKGTAVTVEEAHERTLDILTAFHAGVETRRHEVEVQHTQLVPLLQKALENQARQLGDIAELKNNQAELYKQTREANANAAEANRRAAEADEREREFQESNLELAAKNHQLQREMLEASKETAEMLRQARAEAENSARKGKPLANPNDVRGGAGCSTAKIGHIELGINAHDTA